MSLGGRFRRAAAGVAAALGFRRTTLVMVGQPEPLPPPPPAAQKPRALPAPEHPICSACGRRHPRGPSPFEQSGFAIYGQSILPDPNRPAPLGRGPAHDRAVIRDQHHPWR